MSDFNQSSKPVAFNMVFPQVTGQLFDIEREIGSWIANATAQVIYLTSYSPNSTYLLLDFYLLSWRAVVTPVEPNHFVLICCCNVSGQTEKMADRPGKNCFFGRSSMFLHLSIDLGPPHAYRIPLLQKKINLIELFWP